MIRLINLNVKFSFLLKEIIIYYRGVNDMSTIVEQIKSELLKVTEEYKKTDNYDFWNDHIKYVVKNAVMLADKYSADVEIVELGALLHDIAMPSNYGPREEHHIYGAEIADKLLNKYGYPKEKIERVKKCVLNHRGTKDMPRTTIEEECVADADVMAHFDCIPSLFRLAYKELGLGVNEGADYIKNKLERDYAKLSDRTREVLKDKYKEIIKVLFGEI